MKTFEVKEDFYLDGKKVKIISGGMHYFRTVPEYWRDRLEKLKALGCNTVETYIPWNLHEKEKGKFDFSGILDITRFVKLAQELGLMAAEGRRHAPSLFLSAISTTCERIL